MARSEPSIAARHGGALYTGSDHPEHSVIVPARLGEQEQERRQVSFTFPSPLLALFRIAKSFTSWTSRTDCSRVFVLHKSACRCLTLTMHETLEISRPSQTLECDAVLPSCYYHVANSTQSTVRAMAGLSSTSEVRKPPSAHPLNP